MKKINTQKKDNDNINENEKEKEQENEQIKRKRGHVKCLEFPGHRKFSFRVVVPFHLARHRQQTNT